MSRAWAWNTTDTCGGCNAKGDVIDAPLYGGECDHCGAECCIKCGEVEGDIDGNLRTCGDCLTAMRVEVEPGITADHCGHDDCELCN